MYQLRAYQQEAVDCTVKHFQTTKDPAVIVLPTGAGKSLVIAKLAQVAKGRVLALAHVKELVEQNHSKFISYQLEAGIFSAGLNKKQISQKVIFGSIQSVARANDDFFKDFNLLIIDECHRFCSSEETQYGSVVDKLKRSNPNICIVGLTATPYRLGTGWIYQVNSFNVQQTKEERFFKKCVYELSIKYMIKHKYLSPPVKIDIPVTSYDFSELTESGRMYTLSEVEKVLTKQKRLTPLIVKNIVDITEKYQRNGVMIFSSTIKHAQEILTYLPENQAKIIIGDTESIERDHIIGQFKKKEFKYLVNVSVLTTGFDAPHVDVIAILRPTESISLYQQIIGRGLRLHKEKQDCYILDYTGIGHDIYAPQITDKRPSQESEIVQVSCPQCDFENHFWGKMSEDGEVLEHYGRKCKGAIYNENDNSYHPCNYLFRFKICPNCQSKNDISARSCEVCQSILIDADSKLKQARLSKNAHILKPDSIEVNKKQDKSGNSFLEVKYYDFDAKYLSEAHYLNNSTALKKFNVNFLRSHMKKPELSSHFETIDDVVSYQKLLRKPAYVIARKQGKFWRITEKVFIEELS